MANVPTTATNAKYGIPDLTIGATTLKDITISVAYTVLAERRDQVNRLRGVIVREVYTLSATHEGGNALGPVLSITIPAATLSPVPGLTGECNFLIQNSGKAHVRDGLESLTLTAQMEKQSEMEVTFDGNGNATVAP